MFLLTKLITISPASIAIRACLAAATSFIVSFLIGPWLIRCLRAYQVGQPIRACGPESHHKKSGTPTLGGSLIIFSVGIATVLWADLSNHLIQMLLWSLLVFGGIGAVDDSRKLRYKNSNGMSGTLKLLLQCFFSLTVVFCLYQQATLPIQTALTFPFFKGILLPLSWGFIPFACFVVVGSSNAVNLTDGLDGLAIVPIALVVGALGVVAYLTGSANFSTYLAVPYVPYANELTVVCAAIVGASLGFLWFNTYPAQVFMGDVGSLSLGAVLGVIAVMVRQELLLVIMGGVFVMETVSVVLQVASFKLTGKRLFRMAPIHHHFELKGWPESRIIVRFWIVTVVLVIVGLASFIV